MLLLIPAAIVVVVLLRAGFNYGETVFSSIVGQSIVADVQRDMVRSMAALDLERLNRVHSGQFISNLLYDVNLLREAVVRGVAGIAKEGLSLLLLGSVMIYQDWRLSLIAVLALPIIAWVTRALGRTTQKASVKGMVETGELATALSEMLDGRRIVKAYGLETRRSRGPMIVSRSACITLSGRRKRAPHRRPRPTSSAGSRWRWPFSTPAMKAWRGGSSSTSSRPLSARCCWRRRRCAPFRSSGPR